VLAETPSVAHEWPLRRHRRALREIATFAAAYLTYFGVRAVTEGAPWRAFDNAVALFRLEADLGLDWEGAVQSAVLRSQFLIDVANAVYIYGHWPVLIAAGVLLFRYRPRFYYRLRNVCLLTGLVGLVVFALFPVAPPRLTDLPVVDTITRDSEGYRQLLPPELVNQYAAMPSFHVGWNLLVGLVVFEATRHWLLRAFAIVMPAAMAFAVVATANHFVSDVVAGVAIVLVAFAIVRRLEARQERRRLDGGDAPRCLDEQPRGRAVRRGAPCGQRLGAVAHRRGARAAARRG
jgi:membrane-associated phospholipid phosphatase